MTPRHLLLSVLLLAAPGAGRAQRPDFGPLRDTLATITDVPLLYRLERSHELPGSARTLDPVVRRGLVALRIWELTRDRADAERARDVFLTATTRFAAEPWSHYGHALALAHGPDVRLPSPGNVLGSVVIAQSVAEIFGRDPKSRARRSLRRALELDPGFADAAVLLGELAVADGGRDRELIQEASAALRGVASAGRATPRSTRALADMEIALGNFAAAGSAAGTEADAGVLRARGVALLLQADSAERGAAAYWRGVDVLSEEAAGQYYADVEVLATAAEAADWRVAGLDGRRLWLIRFWHLRAAEGGVTLTERVAEHYQRLTTARRRFVRNSVRGTDGVGILLSGEAAHRFPFDDRGIVYIRHGPPRHVVTTGDRGLLPNETWVYELPGHGGQLFHFVAGRGSQNFALVRDLLQAVDDAAGLDLVERQNAVIALVEDRAPYEPRYQAVLGRLRRSLQRAPGQRLTSTEIRSMLETADAEYRRGARAALRTDSYARGYTGELPFHHDVFTFRTPEARTDLTAAFAIPARHLAARRIGGGVEYALQLSVIVVDTVLDLVTRRDTVQRFRYAAPLAREQLVRTTLTMAVQPSDDAEYRLVVADSGSGRGEMSIGGSRLRDYTDTGLMVSDVVLAHPDSVGDWRRGSATFALALPREFARERPFTVYYELYNLRPDQPYATRITVEPAARTGVLGRVRGLFGGGAAIIDVRFDDVAQPDEAGVVAQTRRLASDLGPGTWRMVVAVTARDGATARTETVFTVDR